MTIINRWSLGEKDSKDLYRLLKKKGILTSSVAGKITGSTLDIYSTYEHIVKETKQE